MRSKVDGERVRAEELAPKLFIGKSPTDEPMTVAPAAAAFGVGMQLLPVRRVRPLGD